VKKEVWGRKTYLDQI